MKKIILLSTFFFSIGTHALPDCPSDTSVMLWDNCTGTISADGFNYVGEFRNGEASGQGTMTFLDGEKYVGEFKDDVANGQGTYTFSDGAIYIGEFKNGNRHGQGNMTWLEGEKYVGEFKDDEYHGQGTYTYASGKKEVGYYMNGEYVPEICEDMGLVKGTETFGGCVLKLIDDL